MVLVLGVSFAIFMAKGRYQQAEEEITSFLSRESLFVWNNVFFTLACASVLLGTLYPLALDALSGEKITVGAPYFNTVMVPIFLSLLLLMAVGPLVPWRKVNLERLKRRLLFPLGLGLSAALLMWIVLGTMHWTAPVGVGSAFFALGTLITDYLRAVRQRRAQLREPLAQALRKTVFANRRHYGGMVVHFGIVIIALGLVGSGLFRSERSVTMAPGDVLEIGGERLRFEGVREFRRDNYSAIQGGFTLLNSGRMALPEKRRYPRQEQPMTESGIDSTLLRDVYVVLSESADGNRWAVHAYVNPLVQFIWMGGMVILSGLLLSLTGRRRRMPEAGMTVEPEK
jgi:cytochrome c-type biogenesis protein CcmF